MSRLPILALYNNKEEIVRRLQNGADINEKGAFERTALHFACQLNYTEIVEILLKHNNINVNFAE